MSSSILNQSDSNVARPASGVSSKLPNSQKREQRNQRRAPSASSSNDPGSAKRGNGKRNRPRKQERSQLVGEQAGNMLAAHKATQDAIQELRDEREAVVEERQLLERVEVRLLDAGVNIPAEVRADAEDADDQAQPEPEVPQEELVDHSLPRGSSPFMAEDLIYYKPHTYRWHWFTILSLGCLLWLAFLYARPVAWHTTRVVFPTVADEFEDIVAHLHRAYNHTQGIYDVESIPWLGELPDGTTNWFPIDIMRRLNYLISLITGINLLALAGSVFFTSPLFSRAVDAYVGLHRRYGVFLFTSFVFAACNIWLFYAIYQKSRPRLSDFQILMKTLEPLRQRYGDVILRMISFIHDHRHEIYKSFKGATMFGALCCLHFGIFSFIASFWDVHDSLIVQFKSAAKVNKAQDHRTGAARTSKLVKSAVYHEALISEGLNSDVLAYCLFQPRRYRTLKVEGGLLKEGLSGKFDVPLLSDADCFSRLNDLGKVGPLYNLAASMNHLDVLGDSIYMAWRILSYRRARRQRMLEEVNSPQRPLN